MTTIIVSEGPRIRVVSFANICSIFGVFERCRWRVLAHFCLDEVLVSCCLRAWILTNLVPETLTEIHILLFISDDVPKMELLNMDVITG